MKEIVIDSVFATSDFYNRSQVVIHPETGLILDFRPNLVAQKNVTHFFGDDYLSFAGMGDIHIHAREDVSQKHIYKECYASASHAALSGGVVHAADMPNNPIPPIDDESYEQKFNLTLKHPVTYLLYAGVGPKTRPLNFKVPYKVYMGPSVGDLFFRNLKELEDVMPFYENQWVSFHCEDPEILESHKSQKTHFERRPVEAEVLATKDAIALIKKHNLRGKLCHYSSSEGLDLIRKARLDGAQIEIEATPQHLFYSHQQIKNNVEFQMNPPIRNEADQMALLDAFKKGEVNFLATDHAPHSPEEKGRGTSGLTGLDTYGAFVTWLLEDQNVSPNLVAKMTSENPGRFCNEFLPTLKKLSKKNVEWGEGFGFLKPHFIGNVTTLKLKSPNLILKENLKTKALNNPFVGVTFPGKVEAVFLRGIIQK